MEQPTEKKASIEEQATTMPEIHTIEYWSFKFLGLKFQKNYFSEIDKYNI